MNQAGSLEVQCVHTQHGVLKFDSGRQVFSGFLDVVVLPYGGMSIVTQMRLGLELKYNATDKQRFKERK